MMLSTSFMNYNEYNLEKIITAVVSSLNTHREITNTTCTSFIGQFIMKEVSFLDC